MFPWKKTLKLNFDDYSGLIQEVTVWAFHDIFTDKKLNNVLHLNDSNRNLFAIEYVYASLFLMVDMFTEDFLIDDIDTLYELLDDVADKMIRRMLDKNAIPENIMSYKNYYLEKSEMYSGFYDRSGESLLKMAKYLVSTID